MGRPLDKDCFSLLYVFRAQDAPDIPKMAPQRRQDSSQDVAKTLPRPPRSSQDPSKTVQDAFKTAQDEPKTLQEAFKSRQDRQNDPQRRLQDTILKDFGSQNGSMLAPKSHQNQFLVKKRRKASGTGNRTIFSIELRSLGSKKRSKIDQKSFQN